MSPSERATLRAMIEKAAARACTCFEYECRSCEGFNGLLAYLGPQPTPTPRWADAGVPLHTSTLVGAMRHSSRAATVARGQLERQFRADWARLVAWLARRLP